MLTAIEPQTVEQQIIDILTEAENNVTTDIGAEQLSDIQIHTNGYVEPGCHNPPGGVVLTGDWDEKFSDRGVLEGLVSYGGVTDELVAQLVDAGAELRWSDQWKACHVCKRLLRANAHIPTWRPYYWYDKRRGFYVCRECLFDYPDAICRHRDEAISLEPAY